MHINIKLEKENIKTCLWGDGIAIFAQDDIWIAMSWDAARGLVSDIEILHKKKEEEDGDT